MSRALIIAEAGVNHNGDAALAKEMIACAAECGADMIKFQTFVPGRMVAASAQKAGYQRQATGGGESQLEMLKRLVLPADVYAELKEACARHGIGFLSTPFDLESVAFLESIGIGLWKVPSGEITNLPYLIRIARTGKPVILSTGMSTMKEVADAVDILRAHGADGITLLHCTTEYPAPYEDVNLRAMVALRDRFGLPAGYSDHTQGIEIPIAAAALGAAVIEKHFTLDRHMPGPDHMASLEPGELAAMVRGIRKVEAAMGTGEKAPSPSEAKNLAVVRKSIVAACPIKKGEAFTEANLCAKRPGTGVSPMRWYEVLGKKAKRDYMEDELIEL